MIFKNKILESKNILTFRQYKDKRSLIAHLNLVLEKVRNAIERLDVNNGTLVHTVTVASIEIQVEWFLIVMDHQFHGNFVVKLTVPMVTLE